MPTQQMNELTKALETFNNVSLPALAFFFAVMFLIVIGILLRGLFGRDARRDDLLATSLKSSSSNGEAITGIKQDIANALNGIREDRAKADERSEKIIRVFSARVKGYDGNIKELAGAINKVNDGIAEIKTAIPTLAKKSEMDLAIGRMDAAIKQLEEAKKACEEKKHKTGELPLIPLPAVMDITLHTPKDEPPDLEATG